MNRIIKTLMNRDGMTEAEARNYYADVKSEMEYGIEIGDYDYVESLMESDFGLELDYFDDIFLI